jgi:hypothetical protein
MTEADRSEAGAGDAGRIVLVIDAATGSGIPEMGAELAAALADRAGLPVTVARCLSAAWTSFGTRSRAP